MLPPADVLPFLFGEDASLREFVVGYFGDAHDPSPLTADDVWAVSDLARRIHRARFTLHLPSLPITPSSAERTFEGLRSERDDGVFAHLRAVLERLPAPEVRRARSDPRIERRLTRSDRADLDVVLYFGDQTFDDLWKIAETCDIEIKLGRWLVKPKLAWLDRLARALARFPEQAAARALDALLDSPKGHPAGWVQAFSVLLLRHVRHPGTLVPLLAFLRADAVPFLVASGWAENALVHLGTREVVAAVAAELPGSDPWFRMHGAHVLGRIKRPESEQALLPLLTAARELEAGTRYGMALCNLCTTSPEAIEEIRTMVSSQLFNPCYGELDRGLLAVCALQGYEPIEAPAWRDRVAAREEAWSFRGEQ